MRHTVTPPEVIPALLEGSEDVEILQLRKSQQSRRGNDIHTKDLSEALHIQIEWVLQCELSGREVRFHSSGIVNHVYILWWPACSNIGENTLL
jgi:hypothetical protein